MLGLKNKAVIITGASTLMGREIVDAFHTAEAKVIMADINVDDGQKHADLYDDSVVFLHTDVTNDLDIEACLELCEKQYGRVDFLVNLACTYLDQGISSTRDEWHQALDVNLIGGAVFIQQARPYMRKQKGGAIVNITSISGKRAQPGRMLYAASKAGLLHMTKAAALQVAEDNIRVNSVSPGWVWSDIMVNLTLNNRAKADKVAAPFHILGRVGDPAEIAKAVLFLCSSDASFITGADIPVDGGYTAIGPEQLEDAVAKLAE